MTAYQWLGQGGTASAPTGGDYSDSPNWSPNGVPGFGGIAGDTISFASGAYDVYATQARINVALMTMGSNVTFDLTSSVMYIGYSGIDAIGGTMNVN